MDSVVYLRASQPNNQVVEIGLDREAGSYFYNIYPIKGTAMVASEKITGSDRCSRKELMYLLDSYVPKSELRDEVYNRVCLDLGFENLDSPPVELFPEEPPMGE